MKAGIFTLRGVNSEQIYRLLEREGPITAAEISRRTHTPILLMRSRLSIAVRTGWLTVIKPEKRKARVRMPYKYTISKAALNH